MFGRKKREDRASLDGSSIDATALLIQARLQAASTSQAVVEATGALETAAGIIGRAFAAARPVGRQSAAEALSPLLLGMVGRTLVKQGEFVALIEVDGGGLTLTPAASWTVTGSPTSWMYEVTTGGPSTTETRRNVSADQVIHCMWAVDPAQPWQGLAPLKVAQIAGRLSAEIAQALADEASAPHGSLLPQEREPGEATDGLTTMLSALNGGIGVVQDPTISLGGLQPSQSNAIYDPRRFGLDMPQQAVNLMSEATAEVLNACGISTAILRAKDAASAREAWRQLLFGTVAPVAKTVERELRAKLDGSVGLEFDELRASDLQGRARAFQSLVGGGMEVERAAALSGMLSPDDG